MQQTKNVFSSKLPYKVRCNLPDCNKPVNLVFRKELNGIVFNFCSPAHAATGTQRVMEKKKLNIRIGVPPQEEETYTGDNIADIEEGG